MTETLSNPAPMWAWDAPPEFFLLPTGVQENLAFEARCMATSIGELMARGIHHVWLDLSDRHGKKSPFEGLPGTHSNVYRRRDKA